MNLQTAHAHSSESICVIILWMQGNDYSLNTLQVPWEQCSASATLSNINWMSLEIHASKRDGRQLLDPTPTENMGGVANKGIPDRMLTLVLSAKKQTPRVTRPICCGLLQISLLVTVTEPAACHRSASFYGSSICMVPEPGRAASTVPAGPRRTEL